MANSDNVIRAGLTPKLRDIPNLVSGLTYTASPPSKHLVFPSPFATNNSALASASKLYDPPIPEFSVVQVTLPPGKKEVHRKLGGPSVGIVTSGGGAIIWRKAQAPGEEEKKGKLILTLSMTIGLGDVFFVGADTEVEFETQQREGDELVIYRAFVEKT
jgi:mannose-6-phosphate isomerase